MDFAIITDHRLKIKESRKTNKFLDLCRKLKTMEHEGDSDTSCSDVLGTVWKGGIRNLWKNQNYSD